MIATSAKSELVWKREGVDMERFWTDHWLLLSYYYYWPSNGPVVFARCRLLASSVVCDAAGGRAGLPPGAWAVRRPTVQGGPVRLRPVKSTPCFTLYQATEAPGFLVCSAYCLWYTACETKSVMFTDDAALSTATLLSALRVWSVC